MSKFTAFPVKGDAFLLEREHYSILVDGGHSQKTASTLDTLYTKSTLPTYIVCTHYDADHVNGLILLLKKFYNSLSLPQLTKENANNSELWLTDFLGKDLKYIKIHIEDLEKLKSDTDDKKKARSIQNAITRTQAYHDLIYYADKLKLNLRFFKHEPHNVCGGVTNLRPINAREVQPTIFAVYDFETFYSLSIPNQKALAFIAPQSTHENAVLFCSDTDICCSDFKLIRNVPHNRNILVTAPHHGSRNNENSYFAIKAVFPKCDQIYIRGHYECTIKIAPSFRRLPQNAKNCTAGCVNGLPSPCSHPCRFANSTTRLPVILYDTSPKPSPPMLVKSSWVFSQLTRTP